MPTVNTILRTDRESEGCELPLYLCVNIGRKRKYYSLKKFIEPKYWDSKKHKVKSGEGNATFLNNLINEKEAEVQKIFQLFKIEEKVLTLESFHAYYKGNEKDIARNFYDFYESEQQLQMNTIGSAALKTYKQMKRKLQTFAPNLLLAEINHDFLTKFESYLIGDCRLTKSSAGKYLKTLRTFIKSAYHKGYIKSYPFSTFKIKTGVSNRTYLTEPELESVRDLRLYNDGEFAAQEMFLFACYTGLRFSDLISITWSNVVEIVNRKGKRVKILSFINEKTGTKVEIPLIKEALAILENRDDEERYIFKRITNQKLNEHLKTIQKKTEINKTLSAHVARHTFATLGLTKGIDITVISNLLGHTNLRTTQIYAKVVNEKKLEEMEKFTFS